jgi:hypothetical protein
MVHATAYSDDRQVMEYLAKALRARDMKTTMVSPAHIRFDNERASIQSSFASLEPECLIRFFPADWLPRLGSPSRWSGFFSSGATVLSNPGTALLLQTKRAPLVWDRVAGRVDTWRVMMPESRCPRDVTAIGSDEWVLKPALGRVGEDVAIAGITGPREFAAILKRVRRRPSAWVAQRRFESIAVETPDGLRHACLGVFTVDGSTAGCYGRVSVKALTDGDSQDVAVLMENDAGNQI